MKEINQRRSIRKYTDRPVDKETIEQILKAAMQAPSAGNQQPWEFLVIQNKEMLQKLSGLSPYATPLSGAAAAIIVIKKTDHMAFAEYADQDLSACTQNILLEACHLELGTLWLGAAPLSERITYIRNLFSLPENLEPFSVIALGYPPEGKGNRFIDRYDADRVHFEKL
ncbi:MAG: nitroreductase family protein [Spirochaetales bacterium]|nr:nitroreductase family protein [Spirochaetales bacterium]